MGLIEDPKELEEPEPGPTGEHPKGKLQEDDNGAIQFAIGTTKTGEVFIDFGTKVKWLAMDPQEALEISQAIAFNAQKGARVRQILAQRERGSLVGVDGKPIKKEE